MMLMPVSRVAGQDGVLDRRRAAPARQQRGVHVDHAEAGEREHVGPEDVAVGDDDAEVGLEPAEAGEEDVAQRAGGLEDRDAGALRLRLDRRRHEGRCASGPAGLSGWVTTPDHLVPLPEQRPEGRHRELRGAEEDDPHHSELADSGCTSLSVAGVVLVLAPVAGQEHLPLDEAEVVEEEDAVEVVDLVLDGAGLEPGRLLAVAVARGGRWPRARPARGG